MFLSNSLFPASSFNSTGYNTGFGNGNAGFNTAAGWGILVPLFQAQPVQQQTSPLSFHAPQAQQSGQAGFLLMSIMGHLMQMMQAMMQYRQPAQNPPANDDTPAPPISYPPVHECPPPPPACECPSEPEPQPEPEPEPPVYPPVHECPPPPPEEEEKITGSAGLFGDPQFGLFSPGLGAIPQKLKAFESGIHAGQTVTLLKDADQGGLEVKVKAIQVDPANASSSAVGEASFKSGNDLIVIKGTGELLVNGVVKGNINSSGLIAPIQLANGVTVSTSQEIDGPNGQKAERFVISNDEYRITAAVRKPHPDSQGYLDMNFEERTVDAADNATGYEAHIPGIANPFGIADLLRLEPGDLAVIA